MHSGKLVFAQLMGHLSLHTFRQCVAKYPSRYPTLKFSHLDQFLSMAFAQLTYRESLRDIETCLRAHQTKLYHLGIRGNIARSTLADANESRDCRIYTDFAISLIQTARKLYVNDSFAVALDQTVYALDTTTIDLCLSVFPWAQFRKAKAAVKMHTLLDLRGNIPTFIHISDGKMHEVNMTRYPDTGSWQFLHHGSRIYRLFPLALTAPSTGILRHSWQIQSAVSPTLFTSRGQSHRIALRSNRYLSGTKGQKRLSATPATNQVSRYRKQQRSGLYYQQLQFTCIDHRRAFPLSLAGRVVLQVDKTASSYQTLLRHLRERSKNTDMDCYLRIRFSRHREEKTQNRGFALHNITDTKSGSVRKNTTRSTT